jgi:hypothetical protein
MSVNLRKLEAGEETALVTVSITGTREQIDTAARDITQVCDRTGVRFTIERRRATEEDLDLFRGEHRSLL